MNREYHKWFSPALQREMEVLVFGSGGTRTIVFPTSLGRFYQWEDFGMLDSLRSRLEDGAIQLFCVDSVDAESWYAKWRPPNERVGRHVKYDRYLLEEVVPFTAKNNSSPALITTGASFGAFHAVNFAFRHPELVTRVLGMSGLYDVRNFAAGATCDALYFNNPIDYLANEHDQKRLDALRRIDITLAIGRDDPSCANNESFSGILWSKDIWHALRIWDGWAHDWPYWKQMVSLYIDGHD
jgi:esterase/lipase superfamily enzyme